MRRKIGRRVLQTEFLECRTMLAGDVADLGAMLEDRVAKLYEHADANADGELTAGEVSEKAWMKLSTADADESGGVSQEELVAQMSERFDAGSNHTGRGRPGGHGRPGQGRPGNGRFEKPEIEKQDPGELTPDQIAERVGAVVDRVFSKVDANEDGVLSEDELTGRRFRKLTTADADGDGAVSRDELTATIEARIAERIAEKQDDEGDREGDDGGNDIEHGQKPDRGQSTPEEIAERVARTVDRLFGKMDANDDGVLSEDELSGRRLSKLMDADADGDGNVSRAELTARIEDRIAKRQGNDRPETEGEKDDDGDTDPEPVEAFDDTNVKPVPSVRNFSGRVRGFGNARGLRVRV